MRSRRTTPAALIGLLLVAATAFCTGRGRTASPAPAPVRLVDLYKPEMLRGEAAHAPAPARIEWKFDNPSVRGWEAVTGVAGLAIRNDRLAGRATTNVPVIDVERTQDLGTRDQVHAIEIRMKVSKGQTVSVVTRPSGPVPARDVERGLGPLQTTVPLTPGADVQTYTLTASVPLNPVRIGRILVQPTDAAGADFEIESIRLVMRREFFASMPSGVSWEGLSEIYRESLVARAPETMTFDVAVPEHGWLDLAIGTIDNQPATFRVSVQNGSERERVLRERTVSTPFRWEILPIDLESLAGRRARLSLGLTGAAGVVGLWGSPVIRGRMPRPSGSAPPQGVIWIHADTLRPDHLSAYGAQRDTSPFLRQLAREGTLFTNAMAQATWTKVSTPSFLTSLYPTTHGVKSFADRIPASATTVAEVYRSAGFATVSYSSTPFTGRWTNLHKGFEELHEAPSQADNGGPFTSKSSREYVDRAIDWIDRHRDGPFFIYLHVFDPHPPYEPRPPYQTLWADPARREAHLAQRESMRKTIADPLMAGRGMATSAEMKAAGVDPAVYLAYDKDWYDGSIRGLDAELLRLFEALRSAGLDDRTVVVFLSDHGEEFQDHGRMWHGQSAYSELAHVPLIIRARGLVAAGRSVDEVVELIDVMPTVLQLSGLQAPPGLQGHSLMPLLSVRDDGRGGWQRKPAITERQPMKPDGARNDELPDASADPEQWLAYAFNDGQWKLIHNVVRPPGRPEFELFDARNDPLDQHDVAADHADVVARLAKAIDGWHQMALATKLKPDAEATKTMTPEQLQKLRSLGYVK